MPLKQRLLVGSSSGREGAAGGGAMYPSLLELSADVLLDETNAGGAPEGPMRTAVPETFNAAVMSQAMATR